MFPWESFSIRELILSSDLLNTRTGVPFSEKLRAILLPITPTPIKPIDLVMIKV